jgi:thiosulfate dehydrogenase (quinone) large subunit
MSNRIIKLFLRLSISIGFLSAVADRFGIWSKEVSVWGNWTNFLGYTRLINPWMPNTLISAVGILATAAEIIFAVCLIIGLKTELFAKLSGCLLLIFALSMTFSTGGAFALSQMKENISS